MFLVKREIFVRNMYTHTYCIHGTLVTKIHIEKTILYSALYKIFDITALKQIHVI